MVTLNDGQTDYVFEKTIQIMPDLFPAAQGTLPDESGEPSVDGFYLRNGEGRADILLTDTSYSPDNDFLGSRVWEIY